MYFPAKIFHRFSFSKVEKQILLLINCALIFYTMFLDVPMLIMCLPSGTDIRMLSDTLFHFYSSSNYPNCLDQITKITTTPLHQVGGNPTS